MLAVWGHALVAVTVVKRFKQESMFGLAVGTKTKGGLYVRLSLVEVQFSLLFTLEMYKKQENLNILKS